jgi:hypothetical protein
MNQDKIQSYLNGVGGREGKVVQTQARLVLFMGQRSNYEKSSFWVIHVCMAI